MVERIQAKCERCETPLVVIPPTLGQFRDPTAEIPTVELPHVPEGWMRAVADGTGRFECPNCGAQMNLQDLP